ncbi:MAG: hypothetical protein M1392_03920 [Gammaproteobacteria bacterium]|nr:hypothetical protein [Gammaproteobacteria bacterium]
MTMMKFAQRGSLLIAAVVLIAVIAVLASTLSFLQVGSTTSSGDHLRSAQALFVAESGLEYAAYQLKSGTACASLSSTQSVGLGSFSTTAAANSASSTLSSAITATGTVIPLASTSGFGAHGRITIGSEAINYAGLSGLNLTGAKRGVAGTTAASYSSGTAVTQNQCMVTSTGAVGLARRVVERAELTSGGAGAIAFDAASSTNAGAAWSHTVGAGSNRILIVGVSTLSGQTVTSVTYTGPSASVAPLTLVGALTNGNGTNIRGELWRLVAPEAGTGTITVTVSAGAKWVGGAVSLTGVDQTSPIDANNFASGTSTAPSVTVTTVSNNAWVVDTLAYAQSATATVGTGQSQRWNTDTVGGTPATNVGGAGSSKGPNTPAGAVAMSWTLSKSKDWVIGAVALKPAAGGSVSVSAASWKETSY